MCRTLAPWTWPVQQWEATGRRPLRRRRIGPSMGSVAMKVIHLAQVPITLLKYRVVSVCRWCNRARIKRFWFSWIENQKSRSVLINQTYALQAEGRLQEGTRG